MSLNLNGKNCKKPILCIFKKRVIGFTNYSVEMHIGKKPSIYEHNIKKNECNMIVIVYETLFLKSSIVNCIDCIVHKNFFILYYLDK